MSKAPSGVFRAIFTIDGREIGREAKAIPADKTITQITARVPVKAGLFGGAATVGVRIEFEPHVRPEA